MKNFLPLLICLFLFACNSTKSVTKEDTDPKVDYCLLSGQVKGVKDKVAMVIHKNSRFRKNVQLDAEGRFSDTLSGPAGQYVFYLEGEHVFCYLKPGFNIQLNTVFNNFEKACVFTGKGAANSRILQVIKDTLATELGAGEVYMKLDEQAFSTHVQGAEKKIQKFIDTYKGLDKDFTVFMKEEIHYECLFEYVIYKEEHALHMELENYKPSEKFYAAFAKIDFDKEEFYKKYSIFGPLAQLYYTRNTDNTKASYLAVIEHAENMESDFARKNIYRYLKGNYEPDGAHNEAIYTAVMEARPDSLLCEEIKAKKIGYARIKKGNLVPDMTFSDVNDKAHKLSDYKGKYIFIDAWATWCAPCKAEIPSLEVLIEAYHGKNITFMSISLDKKKDLEKWKAMVDEKEMQGVQVIAEDNWKSEFASFFMIRGIPRFLLIGPDGKIVDADMPRPSHKIEIDKILDGLL